MRTVSGIIMGEEERGRGEVEVRRRRRSEGVGGRR